MRRASQDVQLGGVGEGPLSLEEGRREEESGGDKWSRAAPGVDPRQATVAVSITVRAVAQEGPKPVRYSTDGDVKKHPRHQIPIRSLCITCPPFLVVPSQTGDLLQLAGRGTSAGELIPAPQPHTLFQAQRPT